MTGRALPDGYETWSKEDELRSLLAAVDERADALALELDHLRPEWRAMQQRAEAAESALRLATNSTPGKSTGVWMTLEAYMDLLAQIATLEEQVKTLRCRQSRQ